MNRFLKALTTRILVLDGSLAALLRAPGASREEMNLRQAELVEAIHRDQVAAGAEIIVSNTLAGNRRSLSACGLATQLREINHRGVAIARRAAGADRFVAAAIGPTGTFTESAGKAGFREIGALFREQIEVCVAAGADLISFETFQDIRELRAAVIAARECCTLPLMVQLLFDETGQTRLGPTPEAAAVTLDGLGVEVIGGQSGPGLPGTNDILSQLRRVTIRPLLARIPELPLTGDGETGSGAPPEELLAYLQRLIGLGVRVIGGGTTPAQTRALRQALPSQGQDWLPPARRCFLSSRTQVVEIGGKAPCRIIGERINPTGKHGYSAELRQGKTAYIRRAAREQITAGADLLDVNCGVPGIDEAGAMERAVLALSDLAGTPLVLDSASSAALERGLQAANGKVLINSVSARQQSLATILPLAKKYGAAIIALPIDGKGIPETARERLRVAKTIVAAALASGLPPEDVIIDCLALAVATHQQQLAETLLALRLVRDELGLATVLGISNISFSLPARPVLSAAFLTMALEAGLKAAIINPQEERVMDALRASRVLLGEDQRAAAYLAHYQRPRPPAE
jgi:5-methyltetrahydrofolate--homocysteine methyltransferase